MEKWVCTWIMSSTIQNIYNNQNYPLLCATHWMQCCGIVATSFQRKHYYGHEHIFVEGPLKLMPYVVFINHSGCGSAGRMGCPAACWSIIEQYAEPINWTQIWEQSYSNCEEVEYMRQSYCMKSSYSTTTGSFGFFFVVWPVALSILPQQSTRCDQVFTRLAQFAWVITLTFQCYHFPWRANIHKSS